MKTKLILTVISLLACFNLSAEEKENLNPKGGEFGIVGYTSSGNGSIGGIYNFGSIFAVRPSVIFFQREAGAKNYGGGVDFQWHYIISNNFSAYIGLQPFYSYTYNSIITSTGRYEVTTHDMSGKLSIGARYMVTDRIAVFANIGASYTAERYNYNEYDTNGNKTYYSHKFIETGQTESANIGVIFYILK